MYSVIFDNLIKKNVFLKMTETKTLGESRPNFSIERNEVDEIIIRQQEIFEG